MTSLPFRWDLARRAQLGSLVGEGATPWPGFVNELRECSVRVLAAAADADLVFVGRSPEDLFDYLTGVLADTAWRRRLALLNLSMRRASAAEIAARDPAALAAVARQLAALGLAPGDLARAARPRVFVDLVYGGSTFGHLLGLLEHLAERDGVDPAAVRRRIRFLGIVERGKNSPNTWRWYQQVPWARRMPRSALRSVSIPYWVWTHMGDREEKVARWHPPERWADEDATRPPPRDAVAGALRMAHALHERGRDPVARARFAAALAGRHEIRNPAVRRLVLELRGR